MSTQLSFFSRNGMTWSRRQLGGHSCIFILLARKEINCQADFGWSKENLTLQLG